MKYMRVWMILLEQQVPTVARHLRALDIRPDAFLLDWYTSLPSLLLDWSPFWLTIDRGAGS